ncbi:MAG: chromate transporter [Burkholderiales bacterium]|nr:chromate transporter [Burkholderiales bacterium]
METPRPTPSLHELFTGFFMVGLQGFGGVLPIARRMMVEDRQWLDDKQFTEVLGLGQLLPGPNIVNVSIVVGKRFHGLTGALTASFALLSAPLVILLILATLYGRYGQLAVVRHMLTGVSAVAPGLVLAMGARLGARLDRRVWTGLLVLGTFLAIAIWRLPLLHVLAVCIPVGVGLGYLNVRRSDKP